MRLGVALGAGRGHACGSLPSIRGAADPEDHVRQANTAASSTSWAALTVLVAGCSVGYLSPSYLMPSEKLERVREAASGYSSSLRFGHLERAASFVAPDARKAFVDFFGTDALDGLRFTDVEIQAVTLGPESDEARVILVVRLYRLPSVSELTVSEEQQWRYDPGTRGWRITPDLTPYKEAGRRASDRTSR
jgi:hypothetical protein